MLLASFVRGFARQLHRSSLGLIAVTATLVAQTNSPSANDGYDPNVNGNIFAIATQGDGKQIIVGQFDTISPNGGNGIHRQNIARLNPDGSVDSFDPETDGAVRAIAIQSDGRIIIGGDFTHVGGVARSYLARLKADGTVDDTFSAGVGMTLTPSANNPATTPQVAAIAIQPADGAIVVGGSFASASSNGGLNATARGNIVRFTKDGVLDLNYDPEPDGMVLALAPHVDGKMLVGGGFTQFQSPTPTTRLHMARLNPDGSVDSQFDPKPDNGVTTIAVQADGKILFGGYFVTCQPIGNDTPANRSHIARLNIDGTLDSEFYPVIAGNVLRIDVDRFDGSIFAGGHFNIVWGRGNKFLSRPFVVRFTSDGTIDESFTPAVNFDTDAFAFQPDGKVIIAGYFTRAQPAGLPSEIVRNHIARVLTSGALDTAFQLDPGGRILASVVQADGKIVVGGSFTNIGGVTRNNLARLNPDGTVDLSYNPNLNGRVYTMAYQNSNNENKVLIGGSFTAVGYDTRNHIARLNPADGSVDSEFNPNINGPVARIVVLKDGSMLVGGTFGTATPIGVTDPILRGNLLKLTYSGQVDASFDPNLNGQVIAIAVQSDNKILIGGGFTALQPNETGSVFSRTALARLNADGTLDTSYAPDPFDPNSTAVNAIVIQSDDKAVVGGRFVNFLPNGVLPLVNRNNLARINKDGTIDSNFDPHPNDVVLTLALESDQKILVGGPFTTFTPNGADPSTGWILRKYFARLNTDGTVDSTLDLNLNEQLGNRVDSITVLPDDSFFVGGTYTSLQPLDSSTRVLRSHYAHITKTGSLDLAFNPSASGSTATKNVVKAVTVQTDGKVVLAGNFTDLGGAVSSNIARYNPEGSPDNAFNAALTTDGTVNALAIRATGAVQPTQLNGFAWLQPNGTLKDFHPSGLNLQGQVSAAVVDSAGRLLIGGGFTDLTNQVKGNLVRFNTDGTVDGTFAADVNGAVNQILLRPNGQIIIAGAFTTVDSNTRNYVAMVNDDGSLTAFDPNPNAVVSSVAPEPDGKHFIIGGSFTSLSPDGSSSPVTRNYVARVDDTGALDGTFDPNLNGAVIAVAITSIGGNEKIILGGSFTTAQPNATPTSVNLSFAGRFNADGTLDTGFEPNPNGQVESIAVDAGGNVVLGGAFGALQPLQNGNFSPIVYRSGIARVASDGTVDPNFDPSADGDVTQIIIEPSGTMLIAGTFNTFLPSGQTTQIARNHLARINANGGLDGAFNPDVAGNVNGISIVVTGTPPVENSILVGGDFISLQPTGLVVLGGKFSNVGGLSVANLAELNGDGSVNGAFQPNPNDAVTAILPLADGHFIVGGTFSKIGENVARNGIARFLSDGTVDLAFNPAVSGTVTALAIQSDGNLLIGSNKLIRVTPNGSPDPSFNVTVSFASVAALAVQPDGRILVAGSGSGTPVRIMRLNADGSADSSFQTVSFSSATDVQAITLQTDGKIIVAGTFSAVGSANISYLARLNADGTVDASFNPAPNGPVTAMALQSDGKLVFGGSFTAIGTGAQQLQRVGIARISNTGSATDAIAAGADGRSLTWLRSGTSAELTGATFEWSSDGQAWQSIGSASRIPNTSNWQSANILGLPTNSTFFVRARGIALASAGQSTSAYEVVRQVNLSSPVAGLTSIIGPVVTSTSWDQSHYVWTIDPISGVIRIADARSGVVLDPRNTVVLGGSVTPPTAASSVRLADLATRGMVNPSSPLISGFAITGTTARTVLVRAVGPGLAGFGVTSYLGHPQLLLYNAAGATIASNTGWNNDPSLAAAFAQTGAFPLNAGSADSALLVTLNPGNYTAQVADAGGAGSTGGDALVEVYDAGGSTGSAARLMNLSSRGTVPDHGYLIGGLVIAGNAPKTLLVRGVGPSLAAFGVGGVLVDPQITVYDALGNAMATNDNWSVSSDAGMDNAAYSAAVSSASAAAGAFALSPGSSDAALVITLPAGAYTIQLSGVGGSGGAAMIEVYELP